MSHDQRPGMNRHRLVRLMAAAVDRCRIDLSGAVVFTEAASGAYVVTPVLAALAGARRVLARTRSTRHGSSEEVARFTGELAEAAGVKRRVEVVGDKSPELLAQADVVTNSGHLRPIDSATVGALKPTAVIPLMYEAWEFREADVDLEACRRRGIAVAGTNEQHPAVNVFGYLGIMAVKQLLEAGVSVYGSRLLLLCDNPFRPYLEQGLRAAGAEVDTREGLGTLASAGGYDACTVALRPRAGPAVTADQVLAFAEHSPGSVVAQFWGDVERPAGIPFWPADPPAPGHMGILPSAVGPEPIVRLQAGGLKVGELLWRARAAGRPIREALRAVAESGFGETIAG